MNETLKRWWREDAYRRWLLVGGFLYALFFAQGLPLWDDDFWSWFRGQATKQPPLSELTFLGLLWRLVWPLSGLDWGWGYNDRPIQMIVYKLAYLISGYESWSYFLYKSLVYAGLGVMIYTWVLRLVPEREHGRRAGLAAAIFFLVTPGPLAAFIMHADFAPTAELAFLAVTYLIWDQVEKTPASWTGLPSLSNPEHKAWLRRWLGIALLTYLAYKTKADLKLIPGILVLYVLLVRRAQVAFFAVPLAVMAVLAIPWGPGIFTKLPPFLPGARPAEQTWMWQSPSLQRLLDFVWNPGAYSFKSSLSASTISLAGVLGPFLLGGMLGFLSWRWAATGKIEWRRIEEPSDRARAFVLIWLVGVFASTSVLPAINYTFRIRYGILTMVPVALLLGWIFGLFSSAARQPPRWAVVVGVGLFVIQAGINLNRSIWYRWDLGHVMVAVDQVYEHVSRAYPTQKLTLFPDFRPYDYRLDAPASIAQKEWLGSTGDLPKKHKPGETLAISWKASLWEQVDLVENFPGCRATSLFDRLFPCPAGGGAFLMRFVGPDPLYQQGEELRKRGDIAGARKIHDELVAKRPLSLAGHFVVGLESYQLEDWARAEQSYALLEKYFPDHLSILYNRGLALLQLKQYDAAIERLRQVLARDSRNYGALYNLYVAHTRNSQGQEARDVLATMKRLFPNDREVDRLLSLPR